MTEHKSEYKLYKMLWKGRKKWVYRISEEWIDEYGKECSDREEDYPGNLIGLLLAKRRIKKLRKLAPLFEKYGVDGGGDKNLLRKEVKID